MINYFRYPILACFISVVISACNTSKKNNAEVTTGINPELTAAKEKVPGITTEALIEGKKIYTRDCSGCHRLHKPAEYTAQQWQPILTKMFIKSKITDSETKKLISDYIIAKSK